MQALEALFSHQSVRNYLPREIEEEKIKNIERAVRQTSSTLFLQLVTVIRVTDRDRLIRIGEISGGTMKLAKAPQLWLFCLDFTKLMHIGAVKLPIPFDLFFAGINDASLCCQSALVAAEAQGLSCVIVGGIKKGMAELNSMLKIPKGAAPVVGLCLGYGDPEFLEQQKPRFASSWMFMDNCFEDRFNEAELEAYDERMHEYYVNRRHNNKGSNWSDTCRYNLKDQSSASALIELYKTQGISFA